MAKTKYKPEYDQDIIHYFNKPRTKITKEKLYYKNGSIREYEKEIPNDPPWFSEFARNIGVDKITMLRWCDEHESFRIAYAQAKEIQKEFIAGNTIRGLYNPRFGEFTMKNVTGWRDLREQKVSGNVKVMVTDQFNQGKSKDKQPEKTEENRKDGEVN